FFVAGAAGRGSLRPLPRRRGGSLVDRRSALPSRGGEATAPRRACESPDRRNRWTTRCAGRSPCRQTAARALRARKLYLRGLRSDATSARREPRRDRAPAATGTAAAAEATATAATATAPVAAA